MMKDRALILFRFYLYCARWTRYDYTWKAAVVFGLYEDTEQEKNTFYDDLQKYIDTNELIIQVREDEQENEKRFVGLNLDNLQYHNE